MKERKKRAPSKKTQKLGSLQLRPTPPEIAQWIDEVLRYPVVKGKSRQFNIRIPWGLFRMVETEALNRNTSVSDFVRECLLFHTVPGRLLDMAKQSSGSSFLTIHELKMLEAFKGRIQKLLDDLKLVEYKYGGKGTELPKPEVLDSEWVEKLVVMKVNQVLEERHKAMQEREEQKRKSK